MTRENDERKQQVTRMGCRGRPSTANDCPSEKTCGRDLRLRFLDIIREPSSESRNWCPWVQAARGLLWGLSWGYLAVTKIREALYEKGIFQTVKLPVPVISVGNLTCGGTGKTPLVEWIARLLLDAGRKAVILSRGYRGRGETSDESQALQDGLGQIVHLLGADRVATGRRAVEEFGADCLILDDAFQHFRVARDLDIVTIDALNPFGYGYVLPRGLLREPVVGLRRADAVVITRADQGEQTVVDAVHQRALRAKPSLLVAEAMHKPTGLVRWADGERLPVEWVKDKRILAFCGIGNPRAFALTVESVGARIAGLVEFADHHPYGPGDLTALRAEALRLGVEAVVTTRKDAVKIGRQSDLGAPLLALDVRLEIARGREELERKIRTVIA